MFNHPSIQPVLFWIILSGFVSLASPVFSEEWETEDCMLCHGDKEELPKDRPGLFVDLESLEEEMSVHAGMECIDCHSDIVDLPHEDPVQPVNCLECHEDAGIEMEESVHATVTVQKILGEDRNLKCTDCHGTHDIFYSEDSRSKTSKLNSIKNCRGCHDQSISENGPETRKFVTGEVYLKCVHYREVLSGNEDAASCVDCHGSHHVLPRTREESLTFPLNIPNTCGKCHEEISNTFMESAHGLSLSAGNFESPNCTTCHGSHEILEATHPLSLTSPHRLSKGLCAQCHGSTLVTDKFKMESGQSSSFFDSYHGRAEELGGFETANCASCHGVHNIFSETDARSTIHQANLIQTCAKCHVEAGPQFVAGKIHTTASAPASWIGQVVRLFYVWLIGITLAFMVLHNAIILIRYIVDKFRSQSKLRTEQRFSRFEMLQHHIIALSFILLAITGFALAYPNSGFTSMLAWLGMTEVHRSIIHRTAGVIATGLFVFHLFFLMVTRKGRVELGFLWPGKKDFSDLGQNLSYHLTKKTDPPRFGRFGYHEKLEYWALIWGMILMSITGFFLWFPELVTQRLPKVFVDVSEIIHFYEAVLATLAIVFWHLFFVVFHPKEYPISLSMFTGKEEMAEEDDPANVASTTDSHEES